MGGDISNSENYKYLLPSFQSSLFEKSNGWKFGQLFKGLTCCFPKYLQFNIIYQTLPKACKATFSLKRFDNNNNTYKSDNKAWQSSGIVGKGKRI